MAVVCTLVQSREREAIMQLGLVLVRNSNDTVFKSKYLRVIALTPLAYIINTNLPNNQWWK